MTHPEWPVRVRALLNHLKEALLPLRRAVQQQNQPPTRHYKRASKDRQGSPVTDTTSITSLPPLHTPQAQWTGKGAKAALTEDIHPGDADHPPGTLGQRNGTFAATAPWTHTPKTPADKNSRESLCAPLAPKETARDCI